jgi:hypothetical protein
MLNKVFQKNQNIHIETFDDGALVLRMPDRNIFQFNLTALKVLELTDGIRNVQAVSAIIAKDYHISQSEAVTDVMALYNHLVDQKIVKELN